MLYVFYKQFFLILNLTIKVFISTFFKLTLNGLTSQSLSKLSTKPLEETSTSCTIISSLLLSTIGLISCFRGCLFCLTGACGIVVLKIIFGEPQPSKKLLSTCLKNCENVLPAKRPYFLKISSNKCRSPILRS